MVDVRAALAVIVPLVLLGAPALWWVFYRMDASPKAKPGLPTQAEARSMDASEVLRIETALGVALPPEFSAFLQDRRPKGIDSTSVLDDAGQIIELTLEYREGAYGLTPWPNHFVYVGDEADASPYVLDCRTGEFFQAEKGNIECAQISRYRNFPEFVTKFAE